MPGACGFHSHEKCSNHPNLAQPPTWRDSQKGALPIKLAAKLPYDSPLGGCERIGADVGWAYNQGFPIRVQLGSNLTPCVCGYSHVNAAHFTDATERLLSGANANLQSSSVDKPTHVPPTLFHAMPGCTSGAPGPSHVPHIGKNDDQIAGEILPSQEVAVCFATDVSCLSSVWGLVHASTPVQAKGNERLPIGKRPQIQQASVDEHTHVPPTLFHAMPGCTPDALGPSHVPHIGKEDDQLVGETLPCQEAAACFTIDLSCLSIVCGLVHASTPVQVKSTERLPVVMRSLIQVDVDERTHVPTTLFHVMPGSTPGVLGPFHVPQVGKVDDQIVGEILPSQEVPACFATDVSWLSSVWGLVHASTPVQAKGNERLPFGKRPQIQQSCVDEHTHVPPILFHAMPGCTPDALGPSHVPHIGKEDDQIVGETLPCQEAAACFTIDLSCLSIVCGLVHACPPVQVKATERLPVVMRSLFQVDVDERTRVLTNLFHAMPGCTPGVLGPSHVPKIGKVDDQIVDEILPCQDDAVCFITDLSCSFDVCGLVHASTPVQAKANERLPVGIRPPIQQSSVDEHTHVPPTLFHAMPGCTSGALGPSRVPQIGKKDGVDNQSPVKCPNLAVINLLGSPHTPFVQSCQSSSDPCDAPNQSGLDHTTIVFQREAIDRKFSGANSLLLPSSVDEHTHVPPILFHAMPGCTPDALGPSHVPHIGKEDDQLVGETLPCQEAAACFTIDLSRLSIVCGLVHACPPVQVKATERLPVVMRSLFQVDVDERTHVLTNLVHAMPGCTPGVLGPSHVPKIGKVDDQIVGEILPCQDDAVCFITDLSCSFDVCSLVHASTPVQAKATERLPVVMRSLFQVDVDERTHVLTNLFHAMPGCTPGVLGPSHVPKIGKVDDQIVGEILPCQDDAVCFITDLSCSFDVCGLVHASTPVQAKANERLPVGIRSPIQQSSVDEHTHVPPTLFHAMPGCTSGALGPSRVPQIGKKDGVDNQSPVKCLNLAVINLFGSPHTPFVQSCQSSSDPCDAPNQSGLDHTTIVFQREAIDRKFSGANSPLLPSNVDKHTHVPPTFFQAMPGCTTSAPGPSHAHPDKNKWVGKRWSLPCSVATKLPWLNTCSHQGNFARLIALGVTILASLQIAWFWITSSWCAADLTNWTGRSCKWRKSFSRCCFPQAKYTMHGPHNSSVVARSPHQHWVTPDQHWVTPECAQDNFKGCQCDGGCTLNGFSNCMLGDEPQSESVLSIIESPLPCTRIQLLQCQQSWVAKDEMEHYMSEVCKLSGIHQACLCVIHPDVPDSAISQTIHEWVNSIITSSSDQDRFASAFLVQKHWCPVIVDTHGVPTVHTTPEGAFWFRHPSHTGAKGSIEVHPPVQATFTNACGFQAVSWVAAMNHADASHVRTSGWNPIDWPTAIAMRKGFAYHLATMGTMFHEVVPTMILFGGAGTGNIATELAELLGTKGVPATIADERAASVLSKIGRQPIAKAMRGQNAWKEIKQLANLASPKVQLVLPSELEAVVQDRIAKGTPFGDRKKKAPKVPQKPVLQLHADDIAIPDGIFRDANQASIKQIPIEAIGPEAQGVVVANAEQASPYLRFAKPVSKFALALIVVDYQNPLVFGAGEEIRFPARCEKTSEPVLLTAKVIQIGNVEVTRAAPANPSQVEEVSAVVIRTCTYRDELSHMQWDKFRARPIKYIVEDLPCLQPHQQGASPIIDVWDRQWLNEKLERTRPEEATLFCVCFRVEITDLQGAMQRPGKVAHYLEPRNPDGRGPHGSFRVIWINKKDRQGVVLAAQQTTQWTCIVRSGMRFGLRVKAEDAQNVHEFHKPNTPFLATDDIMLFHAGPFPHGSNRNALVKLFATWGWQARPSQPKSRAPNGKGVVWEVQAVTKPPYEVYQLAHADILITQIEKRTPKRANAPNDVQGSARTLAALSQTKPVVDATDPWDAHDPWSRYEGPKKVSRTGQPTSIPPEQLESIVAKVSQRLQPTRLVAALDVGDTSMEADDRVGQLEERLSHLEEVMYDQHSKHSKQAQVTTELANQIGSVQQQVERQTQAIHSHIDSKMQEQLTHIERLLSKRRAE